MTDMRKKFEVEIFKFKIKETEKQLKIQNV